MVRDRKVENEIAQHMLMHLIFEFREVDTVGGGIYDVAVVGIS